MKLFIVLALVSMYLLPCEAQTNGEACSIPSLVNGKEMVSKVMLTELEKAPHWNDPLANPPLDPKSAIGKAEAYAKTFKQDELLIETGDVLIRKIDKSRYIYVIQFFFFREGKRDGFSAPLNVVVLMDGTVVKFETPK